MTTLRPFTIKLLYLNKYEFHPLCFRTTFLFPSNSNTKLSFKSSECSWEMPHCPPSLYSQGILVQAGRRNTSTRSRGLHFLWGWSIETLQWQATSLSKTCNFVYLLLTELISLLRLAGWWELSLGHFRVSLPFSSGLHVSSGTAEGQYVQRWEVKGGFNAVIYNKKYIYWSLPLVSNTELLKPL